jgi:hypothetical protein
MLHALMGGRLSDHRPRRPKALNRYNCPHCFRENPGALQHGSSPKRMANQDGGRARLNGIHQLAQVEHMISN